MGEKPYFASRSKVYWKKSDAERLYKPNIEVNGLPMKVLLLGLPW